MTSVVQSIAANGLGGTASKAFTLSSTTAGNLVVIECGVEGGTTLYTGFTVSDNGTGNTWSSAVSKTAADHRIAAVLYCLNISAGVTSITVTGTGGSGGMFGVMSMQEVSGGTWTLDKTGNGVMASGTVTVNNSGANAGTTDFVAGAMSTGFGATNCAITDPPTGYTSAAVEQNDSADAGGECCYRINSSALTDSVTWSATDSVNGDPAVLASFKVAGAAIVPLKPIDTAEPLPRRAVQDFAPPNYQARPVVSVPLAALDSSARIQLRGVFADFAPLNFLALSTLTSPGPFVAAVAPDGPGQGARLLDFQPPNLLKTATPPPLNPEDLSQPVKFRWVAADFNAPNLSFRLPVVMTPLAPQDFSLTFNARWAGSDAFTQNLLTGHLPTPPIAPIDATVSIRAKGVFTDFSPPNLALSTLVPPAALHPIDIATLRLEYRWIRGDEIPLNLLPLRLQTVAPLAPQDLSGIRLEARGVRSDFVPPNLTLTLPVPPPPPVSSAAGRHGTRRQSRRRRELDVVRARIEAFKEQRADADRALIAIDDRELAARAKLLKRVRVKPLTKPIEQYAPIKKALTQRTVATERHRSILGQIRAHQLEAERIQREIESEAADEQAALHLMHYLMMEIPWDE